ncbi:MAG: histidinol-phosphate aminotransferase, partial [Gemmatimonadaceae bacterium]|nr:histidinol-phosphate aminotransferase [Gloeobacterales cyanobacterium ES-bin-141]
MSRLRPELTEFISYHTPRMPLGDKLNANEVPYDLPEWFKSKLVFACEQVVRANRYPDSDPVLLRQQIAQYCDVKAQQVCLGNGSDELIRSVIIAACLG